VPEIALTVEDRPDGALVRIVNKGSGPAVVTHLLLDCPSCTVSTSVGYVLRVNDTHTIIYLPYLGPGEEVKVKVSASAPTTLRGIRATAWSPLGERSQYSLENLNIELLHPSEEHEGKNSLMLAASAVLAALLAFAAWFKLRRTRKNRGKS